MTTTNRIVNEKCHQLELENQQLGEQLKRLSGLNAVANTLVNKLKAEIRQLQEEKEAQIEKKAAHMKVICILCRTRSGSDHLWSIMFCFFSTTLALFGNCYVVDFYSL